MLLAAAALLQTKYPLDHLDLLHNEKPFSSSVVPDNIGNASVSKMVRYTIHTSFDKAVIDIENELGGAMWSNDISYDKATLYADEEKQPNGLYIAGEVIVTRGKSVFNITQPNSASVSGTPDQLQKYHFPKVDPTDWVTISVVESIRAQDADQSSLLPALTHNTPLSYCIVSWRAKDPHQHGAVDVRAGTTSLESKSSQTFNFFRSGSH